ncbi:phage portal protein [Actinomadura sp. 21ATH]|uniref:phage portal protein n=1 Tax=Actinomadura sp. 21ATH TaxID=1735444 RepID=UPI0035BEF87B
MALTLAQASSLADRLTDELARRDPEVRRMDAYYRGKMRLKFASGEFRKFFGDRYRDFADNWCQVVADAPVERLTVTGIQPYGADKADAESWRVWQVNDLDAESQLGFLASVGAGRSFVLVWGNPDDDETPTVTFEDAGQAIVAYEAGSRRRRVAALKWWQDGSYEFATLYLPDEVWKLRRALRREEKPAQQAAIDEEIAKWEQREIADEPNPQPNPMGVVPMVEMPNRPLLTADPISDIAGVVAMQDAINYLWALLFNSADFASLPARAILGAEMPKMPKLNEAGEVIGEIPIPLEKFTLDRVMWIEDENASIANWPAADLKAYTDVIEVAVGHIAAQTRTPAHYLIGKMANLSGDALIAAETGLVKRVEEKQLWMGASLREMFRLIALAQGNESKAQAISAGTLLWADPESRNVAQLTDSLMKLKTIGFPFEFLAARYGLTPPQIADVMAMREREAALDPVSQMMNGRPDLDGPPEQPAGEPEPVDEPLAAE